MNTFKKGLSFALALVMILTCSTVLPLQVRAKETETVLVEETIEQPEPAAESVPGTEAPETEDSEEETAVLESGGIPAVLASDDDLTWVLESDGTLTITGTGYMNYTIPWKAYAPQITKVVIGEGVTTIAGSAFSECVNLTSVSLPGTLTSINDSAFYKCIKLTQIHIPSGVTSISTGAFSNCPNLVKIQVDSANTAYSSDDKGVLFNKDKTVLLECPEGYQGAYQIPGGTTTIKNNAFQSCTGLTGITIADTVTTIESNAFSGCTGLDNFTIPAGVATIGSYAFSNCDSITAVTIPGTVISIGGEAFNSCDKLATVVIENGLVSIGSWAFDNCKNLSSITLPDTLVSISEYAFYGCSSLTSITIPRKITYIDHYAFHGCNKLTSVKFAGSAPVMEADIFSEYYNVESITVYYPAGDATWNDEVFSGSYGTTINWLPYEKGLTPDDDSTVYIVAQGNCGQNVSWKLQSDGRLIIFGTGAMQFMMKSGAAPWSAYAEQITSIVVETGVQSIADGAFADCSNVTTVSVADTVVSIGSEAFVGCESLTDVTFSGNAPVIGENCFADVDANIHYPADNDTWNEDVCKDYGGDITWDTYVIATTPMYRLYNPNSGEHFYTGSIEERDILDEAGWNYEGVAWNAPIYDGQPVYRVYNPNSGDHHYTMSVEEVNMLVDVGWIYENVAWNSSGLTTVPQYRLYNSNADCGSHHYTSSIEERDFLISLGWNYEGIGWFGMLK